MSNNYMMIGGRRIELPRDIELNKPEVFEIPKNIRLADTGQGIGLIIEENKKEYTLKVLYSYGDSGFLVINFVEGQEIKNEDYKFERCSKEEAAKESIVLTLPRDYKKESKYRRNYAVYNEDKTYTYYDGGALYTYEDCVRQNFYRIVKR